MRFEDSQITTDWLAADWGEPLWTDSEKKNRLIAAFKEEQATAKPPVTADDIPFRYEDITKEWLTTILGKGVKGAEVTSFTLGPSDNGTSNRRHISIQWNEAGQKAGLDPSVFCKATQDLLNRITLSYGAIESEVNFFADIQPTLGLVTPEAVHSRMNAHTYNSIIILKDLSKQVKFLNCFSSPTKEQVKDQLKMLAAIHGRYYEKDEPVMHKFVHFATGLRGHIASGGVEGANEAGWNKAKDVMPAGLHERWYEIWAACLISLDRNHNLPQTMVHCDVHRGNWFELPSGKMGLQDFQCFSRGPWPRDIAYLFATFDKAARRREWETELLQYYLQELHKAGGPKVSEEEARREMALQLGSVLIFWGHTLTPSSEMPEMQPFDIALENMERITAMIDDWKFIDAARHFAPQYKVPMPAERK